MKKVILIATVALLGTAWSMLNSKPTQESNCERNNVEAVSDNELPVVEVMCSYEPSIHGIGQCWDEVYEQDREGNVNFKGCRFSGKTTDHCIGEKYVPTTPII